jgi:hypothetical protein
LFKEFHWDTGAPFGTVSGQEFRNEFLPDSIELREHMESRDRITQREVEFDRPIADGGRGWYFVDTGEASEDIHPCCIENEALFNFLDERTEPEEDWHTPSEESDDAE